MQVRSLAGWILNRGSATGGPLSSVFKTIEGNPPSVLLIVCIVLGAAWVVTQNWVAGTLAIGFLAVGALLQIMWHNRERGF